MEVLPSSTPWANGGDAECLAVRLSACESQNLSEEQKQSTQPRSSAASGGCVLTALGHEDVAVYQLFPSCT